MAEKGCTADVREDGLGAAYRHRKRIDVFPARLRRVRPLKRLTVHLCSGRDFCREAGIN